MEMQFSDEFEHVLESQSIFNKLDANAQWEWFEKTDDKSIMIMYVDDEDTYLGYDADCFDNFKLYFKMHIGKEYEKVLEYVKEKNIRYEINLTQ